MANLLSILRILMDREEPGGTFHGSCQELDTEHDYTAQPHRSSAPAVKCSLKWQFLEDSQPSTYLAPASTSTRA